MNPHLIPIQNAGDRTDRAIQRAPGKYLTMSHNRSDPGSPNKVAAHADFGWNGYATGPSSFMFHGALNGPNELEKSIFVN